MSRIHEFLSIVLSAPLVATYVSLAFSIFSPVGLGSMNLLSSISLGILFLTFFPALSLFSVSRSLTGWNFFDKRKRNVPYILTITSYAIGTMVFWYFGNHVMFLISLAYVTVTIACFLVNLFWKISAHAAGFTGPVTALVYVFGLHLAPLYLVAIPIMYSRYKLGSHDWTQLVAGALGAIFITYLTYFVMW